MDSIVKQVETTNQPKEWRLPGDTKSVIRILETDLGPMISQSRSSVYELMIACPC